MLSTFIIMSLESSYLTRPVYIPVRSSQINKYIEGENEPLMNNKQSWTNFQCPIDIKCVPGISKATTVKSHQ